MPEALTFVVVLKDDLVALRPDVALDLPLRRPSL